MVVFPARALRKGHDRGDAGVDSAPCASSGNQFPRHGLEDGLDGGGTRQTEDRHDSQANQSGEQRS